MMGHEGKRRTKCPLCGGEIIVSNLFQYSHDYRFTKSGRISKRYTTVDNGPIEVAIAGCRCGANWGDGEFLIDDKGHFIDYKYEEEP